MPQTGLPTIEALVSAKPAGKRRDRKAALPRWNLL